MGVTDDTEPLGRAFPPEGPALNVVLLDEGEKRRNISLERIIEDPLFKTPESSYFIQLLGFPVSSLLRNEKPLEDATPEPVRSALGNCPEIPDNRAGGKTYGVQHYNRADAFPSIWLPHHRVPVKCAQKVCTHS